MNISEQSRLIMLSTVERMIEHFPCDKIKLATLISSLMTTDKNECFELKPYTPKENDDNQSVIELVLAGFETGLDIEQHFPLRPDVTDDYKNIHSCSVFFDDQDNVDKIIFTLTSCSRGVTFDVEFDANFEFQWYDMYDLEQDKMFISCNDSVKTLVDDMSYLSS